MIPHILLEVEPLIELRTSDVKADLPDGGLCNAGLAKIDGGWMLIARNNSTPGRRPPVGGKYRNFLHTIYLTEDFKVAAAEPSVVVCADFKGCPQDVRIIPNGEGWTLTGCFRPNLGSHFRMACGTLKLGQVQMNFVQAPTFNALGNGDQKNWTPLCGSIFDIGFCENTKEHLMMIFRGEEMPEIAKVETPLQRHHRPRPSAPGFEYKGRQYMSYHSNEIDCGSRVYYQQFALFRQEYMDIESSTLPLRFSHHNDQPIQFLTGAVVQGDDLIVSYGVNDEFNVVGRVKMEDILKHIVAS